MRQLSLLVLLACQPNETSSFRDAQFAQSSPCWAVSLEDGINSTNANEFVALFDCINQSDAFTEFVPLVDYWSITSPDEPNQAMRLASIFNSLSELDYHFSDLFFSTYTLIHEYQSLYTSIESIVVELIYGQSRYSPPDSLTSELSVNTGLVNSALQLGNISSKYLLNNTDVLEVTQSWSPGHYVKDATCSLLTFESDINATFSEPALSFQSFLSAPLNTQNNQMEGPSNDSLKDWMMASLNDENTLYELRDPIYRITSDTRVQEELKLMLQEQILGDNIDAAPLGLHYLLSVDINGGIINANEHSAFFHLMRLMHHSNQPLNCSFNLFGVPITEIEIENFAVQLLTRLSEADDSNLSNAIDLLYLLDLGVAEFAMETIVSSNVCPLLTEEFIEDTRALERLNDTPARPLLNIGLDAVRRLKSDDASENKLYELSEIISIIHKNDLTQPTEELLRDILPEHLIVGVVKLLPQWLNSPNSSTLCTQSASPIDYDTSVRWLNTLLDPAQTNFNVFVEISSLLMADDAFWDVRLKTIEYLEKPDMVLTRPLELLHNYIEWDNELQIVDTVELIYQHDTIRTNMLQIMSDSETTYLLTRSSEESPGPLSLVGAWIYTDTLLDVVVLLDWVLSRLIEEDG